MLHGILHTIETLHRRVLRLERIRLVSVVLLTTLTLLALAVAVDALVRWPAPVRFLILAAGLGWTVRMARGAADQGWRKAPGVSSLAIRLEEVEPRMHGVLAAAFDFARSGEMSRNALAAEVVRQAEDRLSGLSLSRHVRPARSLACLCLLLLVAGSWVAWSVAQPDVMRVGLRRTLTPWSGDRWPARVILEVEALPKAVGRGSALELVAHVTQGDAPDLRVRAVCTSDGPARAEREFDLMRQPDGSFRRSVTAEGDRMTIRLVSGDAEPDPAEIVVRTPPAIVRGQLDVEPPLYAAKERPALHLAWQGVAVSDPGLVLTGSRARLELELAAPTADPAVGEPMVRLQADTTNPTAQPVVVAQDPRHWTITVPVEVAAQLEVLPRDAEGVKAPEPLRISWRVGPDSEPTVSVTDPEADESVTMEASVPFQVQARDDLALASVGWRVDRQQRSGEPSPVMLTESRRDVVDAEAKVQDTLSVGALKAQVGDVLQLQGLAADRYERDGKRRAEVRSEPRRLRVIEREAFERQARQQAGTIREAAARLSTAQEEVEREQDAQTASRAQSGLAERVGDTTETAQKLLQRMRRNGLGEVTLSDTLREAAELGAQARTQAARAQEALQRAGKGESKASDEARQAQREAKDSLQRMVDLLDRDDDAAGAQRRADRLAETINRLRQDLKQASRSSVGKDPEDLSAPERQALQDQAARQRAAAEEAAAMIEDLRGRADRAQEKDRSQANALRQAAEEGDRGQASRRMDEAAERTERNQPAAAEESMKAAADAVDRVRESLREDRRARTEDLKRRLASLSETLQSLIRQAEDGARQVDALAAAPTRSAAEASTFVSRLARNTQAAADEAKQAGGAAQKVAGALIRAGGTFDASVVALRAEPVNHESARDGLSRGVQLLREALQALQQAQREQQAKQFEQERAQLAKQYRQLAADTRAVRQATAGTLPSDGAQVDRRGAATQREQASRVGGIEQAFEQGPRKAEVLKGASTFEALHQRIARDLAGVRESLAAAQGDAGTVRRLDIVADAFESLATVLTDPEAPEDPFADANQGEPGGPSGGMGGDEGKQALPPIAELRLVRQMQQQVNQLTTTLDAARRSGSLVDREMQDLASMQDEVRALGEAWLERLKEGSKRRKTSEESPTTTVPPSMGWWFMAQSAPAPSPQTPGSGTPATPAKDDTAPPATSPQQTAPRTLDELLGIEDGSDDRAAQAQRARKLERSLKEEDLSDLGKAATGNMELSSSLMRDRKDTGTGTQRVQAEALADLDALIEAATQFQKQQNASKSSRSQQQSGSQKKDKDPAGQQASGEQNQPQQGKTKSSAQAAGERKDQSGTAGDQVDPPPAGDEAASGALMEGRSEWGHLPRRVREIMSQARRDPVSALYQQATEAYYRRMAEDRKP